MIVARDVSTRRRVDIDHVVCMPSCRPSDASCEKSIFAASSSGTRVEVPFFRCNAMLVIPTVVMSPTLDEVQQAVNRAVHLVLSVFKAVGQWSKDDGTAMVTLASAAAVRDSSAGQTSVEVERPGSPAPNDLPSGRDRRGSFSSIAPSEIVVVNEYGRIVVCFLMTLGGDGGLPVVCWKDYYDMLHSNDDFRICNIYWEITQRYSGPRICSSPILTVSYQELGTFSHMTYSLVLLIQVQTQTQLFTSTHQ